jgi:signal transduction histidine kinase
MNAISEEELPAFVEEASAEVENTTTFLRNLLFWARSQMDGFSIKKETFPLCALLQENIELLKPQLRKKNLVLNNLCEQKYLVLADKELLNTVIRNLLSNAIKFSRDGGIIDISSRQTGDFLEVMVKDNGVGIPAAAQTKIWSDLLYSTRGTQNEKGTGVGLALCKNFTEKNGGTIRFESEEGKGTTFYFTLPLVAS